jgi:uncharacterized membrane protein
MKASAQNFYIVLLAALYAAFNVSGAALIKAEIPKHLLRGVKGYLGFFLTSKVLLGFCFIAISVLVMFNALSLGKFSFVIPVSTGVNFFLTVLIGYLFFSDRLSWLSCVGLGMILLGIIAMGLSR